MSERTSEYFVGLDLGPPQECTGLVVLERPLVARRTSSSRPVYALRHLQRFVPGTPYPELFGVVRDWLRSPELSQCDLLVDQTGVGHAVVAMLLDALHGQVDCTVWYATLTAGHVASYAAGGLLVPKKELVATVQVLLQSRRLKIPNSLPAASLLLKELDEFRARTTLAKPEADLDWRDRPQDDLVLALALAAWFGEVTVRGNDRDADSTLHPLWC